MTCGHSEMSGDPQDSTDHPLTTAVLGLVDVQSRMPSPHPTHLQPSLKTSLGLCLVFKEILRSSFLLSCLKRLENENRSQPVYHLQVL